MALRVSGCLGGRDSGGPFGDVRAIDNEMAVRRMREDLNNSVVCSTWIRKGRFVVSFFA
jgi:hypothetical protein